MKNANSVAHTLSPKGLMPPISTILHSPLQKILNVFRTLFAKQNGGGDPVSNRPKVTRVQIKVKSGVGEDSKTCITLVTNPDPTASNLSGWSITLKFPDPAIPDRTITSSEWSRTFTSSSDEVVYSQEGLEHQEPNPLKVDAHFIKGFETPIDSDKSVSFSRGTADCP